MARPIAYPFAACRVGFLCALTILVSFVGAADCRAQMNGGSDSERRDSERRDSERRDSERFDSERGDSQVAAVDGLAAALLIQKQVEQAIERGDKSIVAIARVRVGQRRREMRDLTDGLSMRGGFGTLEFVPNEYGAGVVLTPDGLILTAAHLLGDVEQNDYYVWSNGKYYQVDKGKIRTDPWWDLAVVPVQAPGVSLTPIKFADQKTKLRRGQFVIALGNPYAIARDGQASATWGMISNLRRRAPKLRRGDEQLQETLHESGTLIQTDARLEAGYSGGALLNLAGEMIGLTTAQAGRFGAAGQGGFAIPVDRFFLKAVDDLKNNRPRNHGYLGVNILGRPPALGGVQVGAVDASSSPYKAGLRAMHVITHVDGELVRDGQDLIGLISRHAAEDMVTLRVRAPLKQSTDIRVRLAKRPRLETRRETWGGPRELWRGMKVEYLSAIRGDRFSVRPGRGRIGVLSVESDSPAWVAGIRQDQTIVEVNGSRVDNPAQFYDIVREAIGPVTIVDGLGKQRFIPPSP